MIMAGESRLRKLLTGKPGPGVTRIGLGGEGILRTTGRDEEALAMLDAAYRSGIRYYDSAVAYADSERYQGIFWRNRPGWMQETYQAGKSARRDYRGAMAELHRTLERLGRDTIDLWQIHDVRTQGDIRAIEAKDGALRAFAEAKETGLVRGIGVTGHYDPEVIRYAVRHWPVDAVLLPVNPVEAAIGGFLDETIPAAREQGVGVIGMKTLGAGNFIFPDAGLTPEILFRFALAQDTDLIIVGCGTPAEARALAELGENPAPMGEEEQDGIVELIRPYAERLAFYRGPI